MKKKLSLLILIASMMVGCESKKGTLEVYEPFNLLGKNGMAQIKEGTFKAKIKKSIGKTFKLTIDGVPDVFKFGLGDKRSLPEFLQTEISAEQSGQPVSVVVSGDIKDLYSRVYETTRTCSVYRSVKVCQQGEGEASCVYENRSFAGFERIEVDEKDQIITFNAEFLSPETRKLLASFDSEVLETTRLTKSLGPCQLLDRSVDNNGAAVIVE